MTTSVFAAGNVGVITGAASGIGRAAARRFVERGMRVVMADVDGAGLAEAGAEMKALAGAGEGDVAVAVADVGSDRDIRRLAGTAFDTFGRVDVLMNNAASRVAGGSREDDAEWRHTMDVNFWGPVGGVRAFLPRMIAEGRPAAIVNTGSKQGITNPPGNLIYNVTKSALKTYTEGLQHELRKTEGCRVTAHLLVPGWTNTGKREPQAGAWMPVQVVDRMIAAVEAGDFYIICEDNEVSRELDAKRMLWAMGDIIENRPALSRWHGGYDEAFRKFCEEGAD